MHEGTTRMPVGIKWAEPGVVAAQEARGSRAPASTAW